MGGPAETGRASAGPRLATWTSFFPLMLPMMPLFPAGLHVHSFTLVEHLHPVTPAPRSKACRGPATWATCAALGPGKGEQGGVHGSGGKGGGDAGPYLLALLHTQLPADLDALDGVGEEVPGSILQLVLVKGPREVPTQEDNGVGQKLRAAKGKQGSAWASQHTCSA